MEFLQDLFDKYKYALMCETDSCESIENELKEQFSRLTGEAKQAAEESKPCLQEALELGKKGFSQESCEFQTLIEKAGENGDQVLLEAIRSWHSKGAAQCINTAALLNSISENSLQKSADKAEAKKQISEKMWEIKRRRTWTTDKSAMANLQKLIEEIRTIDPEKGKEAEEIFSIGPKLAKLHEEAYKSGLKNNKQALADIKAKARIYKPTNWEFNRIEKRFEEGRIKAENFKQSNTIQHIVVPTYARNTRHPLFVGNLAPQKHWRIYIDETGTSFDKEALLQETPKKSRGKLVALFVPAGKTPLPKLNEPHHATHKTTGDNQKILLDLLEKGVKGCGILGVNLDGMASVDLDYWFIGLERLIDITLRLLPKAEEESRLEFLVENRGKIEDIEKTQAMLQKMADACLYHYAKSFPAEANMLTLEVQCIAKTQSVDEDFVTHNGYIDTVACSWAGGRKELFQMLRDGELINRCLLEGDVQELPLVMDQIARGEMIAASSWSKLLASPDAEATDSPVKALLNSIGGMARQNIDCWNTLVDEVIQHLDSHAVQMNVLSRQIGFLADNKPENASIPSRLQIIWLTAQLAEKNHRGLVSENDLAELNGSISKLYLEDAPLCCWSTLHMAVEETNAFRFENARSIIMTFAEKFGLFPADLTCEKLFLPDGSIVPEWAQKAALVGIRYYGQMFSSLGQHESFLGNFEKADDHFRKAVNCYKLLSNGGAGDVGQTMSYFIINRMDCEQDKSEMHRLMEEYLGSPLEEAARKFAISDDPKEKYCHAIMLRYFMTLDREDPAVKAYLEVKNKWKVQEEHPWEVIEFYRALLLDETERLEHLKKAYNMALDGGPTLHIIASVILGSLFFYDRRVGDKLRQLAEITISEIPDMGSARAAALRSQLVTPLQPIEFAKAVLPFNFR